MATIAVVIVTHNRCELLGRCLDGLARQTLRPEAVYVIDNASTDATAELLAARTDLPLRVTRSPENLGGAGGFSLGMELAHEGGWDWIWLMDDDVVPEPDCAEALVAQGDPAMIAVRQGTDGELVERSALRFDLRNPLVLRSKRRSVAQAYGERQRMPPVVYVENVAFEGFMVHRSVVDAVGYPDARYFIFYDDVDYALRIRRAGYRISAVRDAVMVRQLDFVQQHALDSWKGFYMFRNFFVVQFKYGENALVRFKPYFITAALVAWSFFGGGGRARRSMLFSALRSARRFDQSPTGPAPQSEQFAR
ncbi:MAG: glycosyltransferase family 2 protein [Pigmentiphaga sp.]|uniref:glycosyltransferase family 2 protein n=1 Tax=Pigmentiphaga sp. TaxID=1977564 RepID=UPI0029A99DFD|nr:glycosyltransferase family 2 protein [Pigmentiphaga sp.]MDX3904868.1 glycosyltransferase family 2 protein [Pigmentiphaga sp.]